MKYLEDGGKRAVWVVHRRGGKDLTALHATCRQACRRIGAYWHVYPTFAQARKAVWEGFTSDGRRILDMAFPPQICKSRNESEMKIELVNGSIWRLIGSDKIEVVGAGPVGVVFSEYALAKPKAWDLIRPMMAENNGWAAFITTPRGLNHAKDLYDTASSEPGWWCDLQTIYDTRAYDPDKTVNEARASGMPEALIRQEYLCDWTAANVGSVWGDLLETLEKNGGVGTFDHGNDGMFTTWDLGHTDSTAIWFWRVNSNKAPDLVDHYEAHGKPMSHYYDLVESKPYKYVKHWLPHDARAKSLESGSSIVEQSLERWPDMVGIAPQLSIADGIQAGRWLFQQPMRIHSRCTDGLKALRHYHYEYDEDRKTFDVKPEHDWSSHSADAFRYLALVAKESELITRKPPPKPELPPGPTLARITMDDLWQIHDADLRSRG